MAVDKPIQIVESVICMPEVRLGFCHALGRIGRIWMQCFFVRQCGLPELSFAATLIRWLQCVCVREKIVVLLTKVRELPPLRELGGPVTRRNRAYDSENPVRSCGIWVVSETVMAQQVAEHRPGLLRLAADTKRKRAARENCRRCRLQMLSDVQLVKGLGITTLVRQHRPIPVVRLSKCWIERNRRAEFALSLRRVHVPVVRNEC